MYIEHSERKGKDPRGSFTYSLVALGTLLNAYLTVLLPIHSLR